MDPTVTRTAAHRRVIPVVRLCTNKNYTHSLTLPLLPFLLGSFHLKLKNSLENSIPDCSSSLFFPHCTEVSNTSQFNHLPVYLPDLWILTWKLTFPNCLALIKQLWIKVIPRIQLILAQNVWQGSPLVNAHLTMFKNCVGLSLHETLSKSLTHNSITDGYWALNSSKTKSISYIDIRNIDIIIADLLTTWNCSCIAFMLFSYYIFLNLHQCVINYLSL